jgi:hypothetical protein
MRKLSMNVALAVLVVSAFGLKANAQMYSQEDRGAALAAGVLQAIAQGLNGNQGSYYPGSGHGGYSPRDSGYYPQFPGYEQVQPRTNGGGLKRTETIIRPKRKTPVEQQPRRPMPRPTTPPTRRKGSDVLDINNRHQNQGHRKPLEVRAQRTVESWGGGVSRALGW